jgi:hypothetical protein
MKFVALLSLLLLGLPFVHAGEPDHSKSITVATTEPTPFDKGGRELILSGGFLYSPIVATGGRPVLNYAQGDLSLGWMLTSPAPGFGCDWLRGNWEPLANLFGAGIIRGSNGFLAGGRFLMRYNFVQPDSKWVPFFQLGAGGLGDDVYRQHDQRLIGSGFEFTLVADAGVRYFITPKCAAILMADFEHISNAGTASRNLGVNAGGGTLGIGFFF